MKRKRELDLLSALEGVIQRCRELELAQFQQQFQQEDLLEKQLKQQLQEQLQQQPQPSQGRRPLQSTSSAGPYQQHGSRGATPASHNGFSRNEPPGAGGYRSKSTERRRSAWH